MRPDAADPIPIKTPQLSLAPDANIVFFQRASKNHAQTIKTPEDYSTMKTYDGDIA